MRLWSLHPCYLDAQGLVALWREALLARAVLKGETRGYRHHPQLERFIAHPGPLSAINAYLAGVYEEAKVRGYSFDRSKIGPVRVHAAIRTTNGQRAYEWQHLLKKLARRSPELARRWMTVRVPECHPLFVCVRGPVEGWEKLDGND